MALRSSVVVRDAALYQVSYLQKHRQQGNTTITHSFGDIYHKMLSDIVQTGQRHWWPTKLFFSNLLSVMCCLHIIFVKSSSNERIVDYCILTYFLLQKLRSKKIYMCIQYWYLARYMKIYLYILKCLLCSEFWIYISVSIRTLIKIEKNMHRERNKKQIHHNKNVMGCFIWKSGIWKTFTLTY